MNTVIIFMNTNNHECLGSHRPFKLYWTRLFWALYLPNAAMFDEVLKVETPIEDSSQSKRFEYWALCKMQSTLSH